MTLIKIRLTADDFRTLVSGGEVTFDESAIAWSKGITLKAAFYNGVSIMMENTSEQNMAAIIEEVWNVWPIERKS